MRASQIVDWYWEHGVKRPMEWTLQPSGVNAIMRVAKRREAMRQAEEGGAKKACVAFWGPSQSGKSSLLSHYIDGENDEDLALTWDAGQKVRFSATEAEEGCVVFNPFNGAMDASGVVTRFYLPSEEEARQINVKAPVEVVLASRKQILHALAVGYRMECQESENPWGLDQLRERISTPSERPNRAAFELLFDVCDVCENMARENSRYREFGRGAKLRHQILGSNCVDNLSKAEGLAAYLLWDDEEAVTSVYKRVILFRDEMEELRIKYLANAEKRIYVSMEVAALLEDIGLLDFCEQNSGHAVSAEAQRRLMSIQNVQMHLMPEGIIFTCGGDGIRSEHTFDVSISELGRFQALIGEMKIPLRRTNNAAAQKFFDFLDVCDLLDIPGVTNRAAGEARGVGNLINLQEDASEKTLLSRVYKSGKTLSVVYGQAETYSIDSFVIFVDLERAGGITRPAPLVNGIKAWLSPYGYEVFERGVRPPLKFYLNCSLFGKLQDQVVAAVNGGGLGNYCEKAEELDFVKEHCVDCFFTSNRFKPCTNGNVRHYFEEDENFARVFLGGAGKQSLAAVFGDGLGADYMFERLAREVSIDRRMELYGGMRAKGEQVLKDELRVILPSGQEQKAERYREVVTRVYARVRAELEGREPEKVRKVIQFVKAVFAADDVMFEFVPRTPHTIHETEVGQYVSRQIHRWVLNRKERLVGDGEFEWVIKEEEIYPFLEAVAAIDVEQMVALLRTDFWNHSEKESRVFFAMALLNCFLYGQIARRVLEKPGDAYDMLGKPFMARLEQIQNAMVERGGERRPTNMEGEQELVALAKEMGIIEK